MVLIIFCRYGLSTPHRVTIPEDQTCFNRFSSNIHWALFLRSRNTCWEMPAKTAFIQVGKQGKVVPTLHFACWGAPRSPNNSCEIGCAPCRRFSCKSLLLGKAISFFPLPYRHWDKAIHTLLQKKLEIFKERIISRVLLAESCIRPSDKIIWRW